jgi:hypothetical protein
VVKTGLTVLSVEKVKHSANEKIVFGNVWKLQILAAIIGGPNAWSQRLAKKTEAVSQSEVWISKTEVVGNPTRVRVVRALQWQL